MNKNVYGGKKSGVAYTHASEELNEKNIAHAARGGQCSMTPDKNDQAGIEGLINQVAIDVDGSGGVTHKWIGENL